jgi:hypothetical protein
MQSYLTRHFSEVNRNNGFKKIDESIIYEPNSSLLKKNIEQRAPLNEEIVSHSPDILEGNKESNEPVCEEEKNLFLPI